MIKYTPLLISAIFLLMACGERETFARIDTNVGSVKVKLYNSTPLHRDNFVKLASEGYYDSLLFHRVMPNFMIQAGDPASKLAPQGQRLGGGGPNYTIPPEISAPHFKGALSAARKADQFNPERESSGSQFFIVHGSQQRDENLDLMERSKGIQYTAEQRALYKELGGYPSLDTEYTVFGEVIEGLEVVDEIAGYATDQWNRPLKEVRITSIEIL
ncbi:MAG: peptidylprolyl isomerase [Bacteroidota bacterium]